MTAWVFNPSHADILRQPAEDTRPSLIQQWQQRSGQNVEVDLIAARALDARLISLFMSSRREHQVPDLAEVEINSVGKFFRPPLAEVGFVPLNGYLAKSGWMKRIIAARFAPWSKQGVIFGVPHDLHPVSITYRRDLFQQAGVDPGSARTWGDFQEKCLQFQRYWREHGVPQRHAMQLPSASADYLVVMLLQRGINVLDDHNRIHLTEAKVAQTVAFYAQMVAGPRRIGANPTPGAALWVRDLAQGDLCCAFTPDWAIHDIKDTAPELSGKLAMMPLPRFEPGDAPTSTWGGTMIGIPRGCRNPDESWKLLEFLYLSPQALRARQQFTDILPPVVQWWQDPAYHRADAFFGGQKIDELYVELAGQVPRRYVTPFTTLGTQALSAVLYRAVQQVEAQGSANLEASCQQWLKETAAYLQRGIDFGTMEP